MTAASGGSVVVRVVEVSVEVRVVVVSASSDEVVMVVVSVVVVSEVSVEEVSVTVGIVTETVGCVIVREMVGEMTISVPELETSSSWRGRFRLGLMARAPVARRARTEKNFILMTRMMMCVGV
jgi:hypothetical protein